MTIVNNLFLESLPSARWTVFKFFRKLFQQKLGRFLNNRDKYNWISFTQLIFRNNLRIIWRGYYSFFFFPILDSMKSCQELVSSPKWLLGWKIQKNFLNFWGSLWIQYMVGEDWITLEQVSWEYNSGWAATFYSYLTLLCLFHGCLSNISSTYFYHIFTTRVKRFAIFTFTIFWFS